MQREGVRTVLRDADRHDGQRKRMRAACDNLADSPLKLFAVIEAGTEYDLRMVIRTCSLKIVELFSNSGRTGAAQHLGTQLRVHALHRDKQRRQMKLLDALEIVRPHICHRDKVAVKERQTIVIILDGKTLAHMRGNHIDKAEIAVIGAVADAIEDRGLEFNTEFLVNVLFEGYHLLLAVFVLDEHIDFFVGHGKAQVDDVAQFLPIDFKNLIARHKFQFLCEAARIYAQDDARIVFAHFLTLLHYKQRSDA